jgi:predicted dehydrogenase/glycine/D-amino acid oxidase-like deaminating enzyme
MPPPRILLIGAGRFGLQHLREWQSLEASGEAELAGVVSAGSQTRERLRAQGVRVHPTLSDEVLRTVDAVDIVTPASTHGEWVRRCLPVVPVLVEKPLATDAAEAEALRRLATTSGRVLMVGHLYRFHPVVLALEAEVATIGDRPRGIEGRFINPLDPERVRDDAHLELLHLFDVVDFLFGVEPDVTIGRRVGPLTQVSLRYPGPMSAVFHLGWQGDRKVRTLQLTYADRRVVADLADDELVVSTRNNQLRKRFFPDPPSALGAELRAFVAAIADPVTPGGGSARRYPDAAVGARMVRVALASAPAPATARPRIAVIGGGIFGATCALELSAAGEVTLFERHAELMTETSANNQRRHHSGFHYPRSYDTMVEITAARQEFEAEYEEAIDRSAPAYYCTSATGIEIPAERYLAACQSNRLRFSIEDPPAGIVDRSQVSLCLKTDEAVYDIPRLRRLVSERLSRNPRVRCHLGTEVKNATIAGDGVKRLTVAGPGGTWQEAFDFVVNATYGRRNLIAGWLGFPIEPLRFDLYEILSLRLPIPMISATILDGPFTSLIGIGSEHRFLLSHIHDSVSQSVIPADGLPPDWQERYSNRSNLLRHSMRYLPVLAQASEVGSWWLTRAVGAFARDFDARPTVVTSHGFGCWSVLGGKIITCVSNAREIVRAMLAEQGIEAAARVD